MFKPKAFQLVALAMAAGVLIGAAADRAISRRDVQSMSEGEKNKQVRKDLLSILQPSKTLFRSRNRSLDGDVWLHTRAVATEYQSLCQRDTLSLFYTTTERVGASEEWPAQPYGLDSQRTYRFVAPPKLSYFVAAQGDDYLRSRFASECRGTDQASKEDEWTGWFTAQYAEQAMLGGFAMLALAEWVKDPAHQFDSCAGAEIPANCRAGGVREIGLEFIGNVGQCAALQPDETCIALGRWGTIWTIRAKKSSAPMKSADIRSVDFEQMIVVT